MTDDAVAWLRKQIEGDRDAAGLAGGADAEWSVRHDLCDEDCPDPCPKAGQCHARLCWHAEVVGDNIHVYAEGGHDEHQAAHIALHDPQDVIADCEAKLAILEKHEVESEPGKDLSGKPTGRTAYWCWTCDQDRDYLYIPHDQMGCDTIRALASAYRHRDGYAEHWG
jgi:Family of unknown function (DUF6221)